MKKPKFNPKEVMRAEDKGAKKQETQKTPNKDSGQEEEKIHQCVQKEGLFYQFRGLGILFLCALLVVAGIINYGGISIVETSSTAGSRELPIYNVDTEKKQVALSFDAAWGDSRLRKTVENTLTTFYVQI